MNKKLWLFPLMVVDSNAYWRITNTGLNDRFVPDKFEKGRKHDACSTFSGIILQREGEPPVFGTRPGDSEKDVLNTFWASYFGPVKWTGGLAGWRINDLIWPKLINRSIANGITIPMEASLQPPTAKWNDCKFYDLYNIYKFGSFDRPEIALHDAMTMWLGKDPSAGDADQWVSEEGLGMAMATPNAAMDVYSHVQNYVKGMQKVSDMYGR
jgi:hypothetical protein